MSGVFLGAESSQERLVPFNADAEHLKSSLSSESFVIKRARKGQETISGSVRLAGHCMGKDPVYILSCYDIRSYHMEILH